MPVLPKRSELQAGGKGVAVNGKEDGVTILFDRSNWFIPQILTVTAPDDTLPEGLREVLIQHSVQEGGSADDGGEYDKLSLPTLVAKVVDDDTAGVLVAQSNADAVVSEAGNNAASYSYFVVLTRAPTASISVDIFNDGQVNTSSSPLTFMNSDWFVPQTVVVTADNDQLDEGFHYSRITHALASSVNLDAFFALTLSDVTLGLAAEIRGDDIAQFSVSEDAGARTITVSGATNQAIDARVLSSSGVTYQRHRHPKLGHYGHRPGRHGDNGRGLAGYLGWKRDL